jgi:hypothetical protein
MHVPAWPVYPSGAPAPSSASEAFGATPLAGLGILQCTEDPFGPCWDDGSNPDDGTGAGGSPAGNSDAESGIDVNALIAQGLKAGTDISKLVLIQPGTLQQGNVTTRQTAGFPVASPAVPVTSTKLGVKSDTGGSILIAAGVAIAAVVLMSGRKG